MRLMLQMLNWIHRIARKDEGQSMVEYGLIIALIAIFVIAALVFLHGQIANLFGAAGNALSTTGTG